MLLQKLALGTVQFGLDYGVNNTTGKIPSPEIERILNSASDSNIDTLDTAFAYGTSEEEIGNYLKAKGKEFKIVSKLPDCSFEDVEKTFQLTLKRLNAGKIYGYLLHSYRYFLKYPDVWDLLNEYKSKGLIQKIGFSLYYPSELEELMDAGIKMDLIQIPYNILDQRFGPCFNKLRSENVEIHTRSVFLQGLLLKDVSDLNPWFTPIKDKLIYLNTVSRDSNIPLYDICLNFVRQNANISKIVVGVDNNNQLTKLVDSVGTLKEVERIYDNLHNLQEKNEDMIIPYKWRLD